MYQGYVKINQEAGLNSQLKNLLNKNIITKAKSSDKMIANTIVPFLHFIKMGYIFTQGLQPF